MKQRWKESYQRYNDMIQEEKRLARQSAITITCEEDCILVEQARDRLAKSINDYRRQFGRPSPVTL